MLLLRLDGFVPPRPDTQSKHLLQYEAELGNEARESEGAVGIHTIHVLQDALLFRLKRVALARIVQSTSLAKAFVY